MRKKVIYIRVAIELANSNNVILRDRDRMSEMIATITNYEQTEGAN